MKRMVLRWVRMVKKPSRARRRGEAGYSLLEVLIVLTIIALIAALVGPRLMDQLDRSKVKAARLQIEMLSSALDEMNIDLQRYPTAQEGLALLVTAPAAEAERVVWQAQGYLRSALPNDPWGRPYLYVPPQADFARPIIKSLGADGEEGGSGLAADISNGDPP
ncbi:MAG: type II secretion system major pseudopilin GspG [Terricaulis sp.]